MRKNKITFKTIKNVYQTYEITGLNLDNLLNDLSKNGVELHDIKKISQKTMFITIKIADVKKFFAISEQMCYTKRKVKTTGSGYPLLFFVKNLGVAVGMAIFIMLSIFMGDLVFSVSFYGNGSIYKAQVQEYLASCGVVQFSRFSHIDLNSLSNGIMVDNPHILFAQCTKNGNRLEVELILKENDKTLSGSATSLIANKSGIIEQLKVYRGTALIKVGDSVSEGDIIVDGYTIIKDKKVQTNVVACASIRCFDNYQYVSESEKDSEIAKLSALAFYEVENCEIFDVEITKRENKFIYNVTLTYLNNVWAG